MALDAQTAMDDDAIDDLLERHETGVLSLARDGDPYAIPISYGYDGEERRFYFRLVSTPESEKRRFLAADPPCRLVVYEDDHPVYRSVLARGDLESVDPGALDPDDIAQYGSAKRPLFEIWSDAKPDLDVQLFRFDPVDLAGRRIDVRDAED
jgi:nitroimidazol reductase NimA-like FMN-containing flavoprotein (pyridoxamine 5'-phosphate oxidase superfamily)